MSDPNVITACENVCRDFAWLPGLMSFFADFATVVAAIVAVFAVVRWKTEQRLVKRSNHAFELLKATRLFVWDLQSVRDKRAIASIEAVKRDGVTASEARARFEILNASLLDSRNRLAEAFQDFECFADDPVIDGHVKTLLKSYQKVLTAIRKILTWDENSGSNGIPPERLQPLSDIVYRSGNDDDQISKSLDEALTGVETRLKRYIRFEN